MKLRSHLTLLVVGAMTPLLAVAVIAGVMLVRHERASVEREAVGRTRAAMSAIDAELRGAISSVKALASSRNLEADDLRAFHEESRRVLATQAYWLNVGLVSAAKVQLFDAIRPFNDPAPSMAGDEALDHAIRSGRVTISNVAVGAAIGVPSVRIRYPIARDGAVRYVISVALKLEYFADTLKAQQLPADWVIALVDRDRRFIARLPPRPPGDPISPSFLEALRRSPEGFFRGQTVEGFQTYTPYVTSGLSGWALGIAVPASVIDAGARRLAGTLAGGLVVALVIAWWLAWLMARRIARPIGALANSTQAMVPGGDLALSDPGRIDEIVQLHQALTMATQGVRERQQRLEGETDALRRAEGALKSMNQAKDEFLAMLGHELRNPLGAIAGAVSLLDVAGGAEETAERARAVIGRQIQHLTRLVDDLLDVSRVTSRKVVLVRQPLDLGQLVTDTVNVWRSAGRLDRHQVSVEVASVSVDADETRMEQVLSNLLSNAVKYTPAGGSVGVRVAAERDTAVLEVADTGAGIPPGLGDRIFDLFVQGERTLDRTQGGLGIGLTLVKALVEMHGGTVQVRSDGVGKGAVFTVRLPRVSAATEPPPLAAGTSPAVHVPRRIVIIEDNQDAREMLGVHLRLNGHEVHEAADGRTGVAVAARVMPEVALIDVGLPGLDGYEVARQIRAGTGGKAMVFIAVTGYGQAEDRQRAAEAGFDAHVAKPVPPQRLAELIAGGRPDTP